MEIVACSNTAASSTESSSIQESDCRNKNVKSRALELLSITRVATAWTLDCCIFLIFSVQFSTVCFMFLCKDAEPRHGNSIKMRR